MLARDFLKDYVFLAVGRVGSTSENITQKVRPDFLVLKDILPLSGRWCGLRSMTRGHSFLTSWTLLALALKTLTGR